MITCELPKRHNHSARGSSSGLRRVLVSSLISHVRIYPSRGQWYGFDFIVVLLLAVIIEFGPCARRSELSVWNSSYSWLDLIEGNQQLGKVCFLDPFQGYDASPVKVETRPRSFLFCEMYICCSLFDYFTGPLTDCTKCEHRQNATLPCPTRFVRYKLPSQSAWS